MNLQRDWSPVAGALLVCLAVSGCGTGTKKNEVVLNPDNGPREGAGVGDAPAEEPAAEDPGTPAPSDPPGDPSARGGEPSVPSTPAGGDETAADPVTTTPQGDAAGGNARPGDSPQPSPPDEATADNPNPTSDPSSAVERLVTGDSPMWGGTPGRNMVNATTGISIDFRPAATAEKGQNLLWVASLGSQTYANPVVASGRVFVGTNNGGEFRPKHRGDRGCLICFDEKSGKFLWQLTREKLPQGRVNDWPEQGICSTACVEGDRLWVVTNRAELMCVDIEGFHDGENDGPITDEVDNEELDADIVWSLDMIEELGVFPHNLATSSPLIYGDCVYLLTSNGVDEAHLEIPSPRSPSFLAVNKTTGEVVWEDNSPFDQILHGQWSSPAAGDVNGRALVFMPGGDGWLYALDAKTGDHVWKFDLNPKDAKWELGIAGTRNAILATPVFFENSVFLAVGQDPEHNIGVGHLYRIDATREGDISPQLPDGSDNPNSGQIWHYGGIDHDGSVTGEMGRFIFRRTMSSCAVADGLVFAPDLAGYLHCVDLETGRRHWEHDTFAAVWGSPMVADGKMFLGDEDGELVIMAASATKQVLAEKVFPGSIYSTPTFANGVMFVTDRSRLYAFSTE